MSLMPLPSFTRTQLRDREVTDEAARRAVEIRMPDGGEPLVLMPRRMLDDGNQIKVLAALFIQAGQELQRDDPSPIGLGEVSYVASWSPTEQHRFMRGFAEALFESVRTEDPTPARRYVEVMARADTAVTRPDFTGALSPAAGEALAARMARRTS